VIPKPAPTAGSIDLGDENEDTGPKDNKKDNAVVQRNQKLF
jgi:hypothetical protein